MRLLKTLFILGFLGFALWGCDGGGGEDEGQQFFALTNSPEVVVGGIKGSVDGRVTVLVRNLDTGQERETTANDEGSFIVTLEGSIGDTIGISAPRVDVAVEVMHVSEVSPEIRQEIMSGAVRRNLASLGSFPTTIEIQGNRGYVVNGGSNNIQIFDLNQDPPQQIGTIVLPPGSDPVAIAFLDDTRAYVANLTGQSVALVNVQAMQCELLIVRSESLPSNTSVCQNQVITVGPEFFEDPSGIAIASGKVYVTNSNLETNNNVQDCFVEPIGNGFITVINSETNQVLSRISTTGQGTAGITDIDNNLYVVNGGDLDDCDTGMLLVDPEAPVSIDVIDSQNDNITTSIPIPPNTQNLLIGFPNRVEPTHDKELGYVGSGIAPVLFKIDLVNNTLIRGTDDPITLPPTNDLDATFDVEIRNDGLAFIALFNSDRIAVMDTADDSINPFPFIAPFPAGLRADDPNSQFFDGVQDIAIRTDGNFPDVFFITGLSNQLGSIDSSLILPPD
jgi:hypothetical protein